MPWRPLPRIAFAVAIYPFAASSPSDLPLELGDELYIIEQGGADGSWYRGYLVAPPSLLAGLTSVKGQILEARVFSGIFPRCCVEVREELGDSSLDGKADGVGLRGNNLTSESVNGTPQRDWTLPKSKNTLRRSRSGKESLGTTTKFANGQSPKDSGIGNVLSRSSSHQGLAKGSNNGAVRNSSQRSTRSHRSLGSSISLNPLINGTRDRGAKRPSAPVPMLKIGDETPTSSSEPLVDEIASCLREWHSQNLHELLLTRRYTILEKISNLVYQLDLSRRQLLHDVLTPRELLRQREKIVWDLVNGNKMLDKEVIVRDPKQNGRLLTGDDSVVDITKLQSTMGLLDMAPHGSPDVVSLFHLGVEVKAFQKIGADLPALHISLHSWRTGGLPKQLTESFAIDIPADGEFDKALELGRLRTLFTNLSPSDVGEAKGSESNLYLVIKAQASHSVKSAPSGNLRRSNVSDGTGASSKPPYGKGGRRSLMWAPKQFGSIRHRGPEEFRTSQPQSVMGSSSALGSETRPGTQDSHSERQQNLQYVKRIVGVGVLDFKRLLRQEKPTEYTVPIWFPAAAVSNGQFVNEAIDGFIHHLLPSPDGRYGQSKTLSHVRLSLQYFEDPDVNDLIKKTSTLPQSIAQTPKIGFSSAPTGDQSDIYLTLSEAFLPSQALLSHPERGTIQLSAGLELKNVQLTLEVRKTSGERIEKCIFPTSNSPGLTAWRTSAVPRGEPWNQIIKLVISQTDVPEAHLIMSLAEAPNFPFALSWLPLWSEEAFIKNGSHTPLLYIYDKLTSSSQNGRGAYMTLPWNARGRDDSSKDEMLTGPVAMLKLETYLCSTTFSQDKVLLGILKWRHQPKIQVLGLLKRFGFVSSFEIVKLASDVFDALFGILVDYAGDDESEDILFDALVTALGTVHDRRFNLGPFVDQYAETRFDHPFAAPCLIRSYLRLLAHPANQENSRRLRAAVKVGRYILKFIIIARKKQVVKEGDIGVNATEPNFSRDLKDIFHTLEALMTDPSPTLVGSKTLVVQHMHTWLPELQYSISDYDIFSIAKSFVDSCIAVQGKLILYKLLLILNLNKMPLFKSSGLYREVANHTIRWIHPHWGTSFTKSDQWRDQVRLCCSIASVQTQQNGFEASDYFLKVIQSYQSIRLSKQTAKSSFSLLFPTSYPFPTKSLSKKSLFDEALVELAAVLAQQADTSFVKSLNQSTAELTDTLFASIDVITSILNEEAFPGSWLSLYIYHHRSSLQLLESIFQLMVTNCVPSPDDADHFNTELWSRFLRALLNLIKSDALALETFAEQKRRAVWRIAGDVREDGAGLLRRSWEAIGWESTPEDYSRYGIARLGGYQVQYVPTLVAPIVQLCLSVHEGLRSAAVRILQTMIVSEWTLSEDLSVIEAETISCIDDMFKSKAVSEGVLQKVFLNELLETFESSSRPPGDSLWLAVKRLVSTIDELLDLLVAAYCPDGSEPFRITQTLQLMDFLRDMQKVDMYIRYVHQLADMQAQAHNHAEAGLALRLHADIYEWNMTMLEPLADPMFPEQSSFERKEQLYFEMIKYFEQGSAWNLALESYGELADRYQQAYFDFSKLARTQRSMAKIYDSIAKGDRHTPRYFRVVYRGLGFSPSLKNKEFIFEGGPMERQIMFADRMRQQYPSAQIVTSDDVEDAEGQYLQITTVNPHKDVNHHIFQQPKVAQSIRDFLLLSNPDHFSVTSRRHSPTSDVRDEWIEKTVYTTSEPFPNVMQRSEIVSTAVLHLSPLQTAIERTSRKTSELALLDKRVRSGDQSALPSLTEALRSSVESSSLSSVAQYRQFLPEPKEPDEEESVSEVTLEPPQNALKIALVDHASMLRHCMTLYPDSDADQSSLSQSLYENFAPEFAILNPHPGLVTPIPASPSILAAAITPQASPLLGDALENESDPSARPPLATPSRSSRLSLSFLKSSGPKSTTPATVNGVSSAQSSSNTDTTSEVGASEVGSTMTAQSANDRRPSTALSAREGKVKKRLSVLRIGIGGEKGGRGKAESKEKAIQELVEE